MRVPVRRRVPPRRWSSTPIILLGAFVLINLVGGALLYVPWAVADGPGASLQVAFFTAVSASTVTGLV